MYRPTRIRPRPERQAADLFDNSRNLRSGRGTSRGDRRQRDSHLQANPDQDGLAIGIGTNDGPITGNSFNASTSIHNEAAIPSSDHQNWLENELNLDITAIQRRKYEPPTVSLQNRVWDLWCRTLFNFFDYTITTRRQHIDAASTIQTYWNYWTLIRKHKFGLSIPPSIKDGMVGVRSQLGEKHGLRTDPRDKPTMRTELTFEVMRVIWTAGGETWDPVQLGLIVLLAGITGHRPGALLSMTHSDLLITLFRSKRMRPQMVLEVRPHKTKRYRGRNKKTPTIGIPEVPSEPCLLLCPKTHFLGLLLRKSAFRHVDVSSASQLYGLQVAPEARSLPLIVADKESRVFDITEQMLNRCLQRLGELTGLQLSVTSYWLRRSAAEVVNTSSEISEAQQNLLLQHANASVYQKRYASDYFPSDLRAIAEGREQQHDVMNVASGQSRTIDLRRPVDLTDAQKAEAEAHQDVQRCKRLWLQARVLVCTKYGSFRAGTGTELYREAVKMRNSYHTARARSHRKMKKHIRARFDEEQPIQDVFRQVHGLPMASRTHQRALPTCPDQERAFSLIFRFAPSSEEDETDCRIRAVDAISRVGPISAVRLRTIHSGQTHPKWMQAASEEKRGVLLNLRQCLVCSVFGIREASFTTDFSFLRHLARRHPRNMQCPDPACREQLKGIDHIMNHMRHVHGA
ncbi:hypothetical protein BJY01DRAFT_261370 [Aspergillus pseudoustus]|uniref:C2H2-type domain-containing protein n=1 Tax=Aspergillus pseudoustus TaxID=1810923 RepID=A0ABR4IN44_9EURO